ncbi:Magnesium and cobalt efflux protein CorC [gamma proteobacterium IMCC2047]|nr:Magnesium and cobalt efflux protein CorC [gamma proteobacterium IMCC2047]
MSDDHSTKSQDPKKSWLDKITQAFSTEPQSPEDVREFLGQALENHLLDNVAFNIIEGAIEISDLQVRDVMIPRPQMTVVKESQSPEEFLPLVIESGHSRFPVIGDNPDEVTGILLAKDLLPLILSNNADKFKVRDVLRAATIIPESKRLTQLLNEFRTNRYHMAVVVDEYGGISGLITIEDVLEEIVGEIEDEYDTDEEDAFIRPIENGQTLVNALTPIEDFNEHFDLEFSDDEFDTIGGIVMKHFGRLPSRNESIEIAGLKFKVLTSDKRRIRILQVSQAHH